MKNIYVLASAAICSLVAIAVIVQSPTTDEEGDVELNHPQTAQSNRLQADLSLAALDPSEGIERSPVEDDEQVSEPRSGIGLVGETVTLESGVLLIGGVPLAQVDYGTWRTDDLQDVLRQIQTLQIQEMDNLVEGRPVDHLFVTSEEYVNQRRWHEDLVVFGSTRDQVLESGEVETEYGYLAFSPGTADTAFTLRDEVVRIYSSPAYSESLLLEGSALEAEVLEKFPQAITDVTSDLTHWAFFNPDGSVIASIHYPKNGNQ